MYWQWVPHIATRSESGQNYEVRQGRARLEAGWEGGTIVCINGPGYKTKMAASPIYGKNL